MDVSGKLLQETYISLKEKLNIIDAIFHNRYAFYAHAEGEA